MVEKLGIQSPPEILSIFVTNVKYVGNKDGYNIGRVNQQVHSAKVVRRRVVELINGKGVSSKIGLATLFSG